MKNIITDVKFSTSNKATDICLARAKYITEAGGEELTKKNINKYYKKCLKQFREDYFNNTEEEVGFLRCLNTNVEVGFYLKTSYSEWDSLSILYVNPDFRGEGHSETLINLYEMDCKDISVIELSSENFEEQKSLYEYVGYTKTVGGLFPTSIALIKEGSLEALDKAVQADFISYESIYEELVKATKDCSTRLDYFKNSEKIMNVFKVFKNEGELTDFCKYALSNITNKNHSLDDFIRGYLYQYTNKIAA